MVLFIINLLKAATSLYKYDMFKYLIFRYYLKFIYLVSRYLVILKYLDQSYPHK